MNHIGGLITFCRTTRKMSQEELAKKSGVCRATIASYETGKRKPKYEVMETLLKAMDYKISIVSTKGKERSGHGVNQ